MENIQCIETYKDLVLKKMVVKDSNINELYDKHKIELTEERISYLVDERHLCKRVKKNDSESKTNNITTKKTNKKDTKK